MSADAGARVGTSPSADGRDGMRPDGVRPDGMRVRGNATPEELAAVLALLSHGACPAEPDRYAVWRRTRLAALR